MFSSSQTRRVRFFFVSAPLVASMVTLLSASDPESSSAAEKAATLRKDMHYYLKGRYIFQSQCVPCHGRTGRGDGPWSVDLTDKPRNFRVGIFKFRTTPYGKLPTVDDLRRTIRSGISGTAMPSFKKLTDDDVTGLIAYLQNLSKRWDDDTLYAESIEIPETPKWFADDSKLKSHAKSGQALFSLTCIACHGPEGKGDGPGSKGLIDIWENPITPGNLTREHHKSGDAPSDLFRTIATGLDGTPMVGFREQLNAGQIWNLVAFIKSIEAPEEEAAE